MAQQVTATLGCLEQNPDSVIDRAEAVMKGLTSNPHYVTPNPSLATLSAALTAARAARTAWNKGAGATSDHAKYKGAIKTLFDLVEQLCAYVNNTTLHNETALATSGFPLSNAKHKRPLMEPPQGVYRFMARNIGLEKVKINCRKPANASKYQRIVYKFYRSTTTNFVDAVLIATETKTSHIDIPKITVATSFYYWVTAVTPAGESEPSDLCHAVAVPL